ncbi:hypothetical protein Despr_3042 [Desulfobulbus propionicus DSM 2032]|jgi:hypothetical protein|uniref:Lipocalin-like domain-containing protein n=1 Tax=Desulfobulbus propionicus (strain ATCC 33891 / DSM 2032 / VKM B-1956 / 1pr3) TaxID=577650 RepID=A0A7U3YPJ0_DESPD|nr:hypothetical protein [Desulfobulbus propionicus]ADW19175.1 hypothetical protein Despr_3042 [Desulfobulbus propionicus DSM 2032]
MTKKRVLLVAVFCSFLFLPHYTAQAAASFAKPNLAGTWFLYITINQMNKETGSDPTSYFVQKSACVWGTVSVNKSGVVNSGTTLTYYDYEGGSSLFTVTGGALIIAKNGVVTGGINVIDSSHQTDTITIANSKMEPGKKMIAGIVKDAGHTKSYGMFSAVKR